jgi:hypothetical protein
MQSLYRRFISMAFLAYTAAGHLRARLGQSLRPEAGHERGSFYAPSGSPASFRRAKSTSRSR